MKTSCETLVFTTSKEIALRARHFLERVTNKTELQANCQLFRASSTHRSSQQIVVATIGAEDSPKTLMKLREDLHPALVLSVEYGNFVDTTLDMPTLCPVGSIYMAKESFAQIETIDLGSNVVAKLQQVADGESWRNHFRKLHNEPPQVLRGSLLAPMKKLLHKSKTQLERTIKAYQPVAALETHARYFAALDSLAGTNLCVLRSPYEHFEPRDLKPSEINRRQDKAADVLWSYVHDLLSEGNEVALRRKGGGLKGIGTITLKASKRVGAQFVEALKRYGIYELIVYIGSRIGSEIVTIEAPPENIALIRCLCDANVPRFVFERATVQSYELEYEVKGFPLWYCHFLDDVASLSPKFSGEQRLRALKKMKIWSTNNVVGTVAQSISALDELKYDIERCG